MRASVIIPAHNEERYIESTLRSISCKDIETIVVCNGCTDKTEEIARQFADKVYVLEKANVSAARNFGVTVASSDRLVFLDADIRVQQGLIDKIIESKAEVGTSLVKPDTKKLRYEILMGLKSYVHKFGFCSGLIFCDKNLFIRAGGFNEAWSFGEDGSLLRTMKSVGRYGVVKGYVYNNMRRFEKIGIANVCLFWVRRYLFFGDRKKYSVVR